MNFLKTFFGQIFRKSDIDFQNFGVRGAMVSAHVDLSLKNGGIISGLNLSKSIDNKSITVSPGVFYSKGDLSSENSQGGGERCQVFSTQTITGLPETPIIVGQQTYLLIYAKSTPQNNNPDPTASQTISTSKNVATNENLPIRQYNGGIVVVTNPILRAEVDNIGGVPIALLTTDSGGNILTLDLSVRHNYAIGGIIDVPEQRLLDVAFSDNFIISRMIDNNQAVYDKLGEGLVISNKIALWDGISETAASGSGISTAHFKSGVVSGPKLSPSYALDQYSSKNFIFNGSFEITKNTPSEPDMVGWDIYNQATGDGLYFGPPALVQRTITEANTGFYSAMLQGADPNFIAGGKVYGVSIYQDTAFQNFPNLNNLDIMSSFYMKTSAPVPVNVSGVSGINASIQFISSGSLVDREYTIVNYTGGTLGEWTRFQTNEPIKYTGNHIVDSIRFRISGNITNSIAIFIDDVYVGPSDVLAPWAPSDADSDYSNVLNIRNLNISNNIISTNVVSAGITGNIQSAGAGVSTLGSQANPVNSIFTNDINILGQKYIPGAHNFVVITGTGLVYWTIPSDVTHVVAELWGAGGGGAAGTDTTSSGVYAPVRGHGGGGGGAGQYVRTLIPGVLNQTIVADLGIGGSGGIAGVSGAPISQYRGKNGTSTFLRDTGGAVLAEAIGGYGGGFGYITGVLTPVGNPYLYNFSSGVFGGFSTYSILVPTTISSGVILGGSGGGYSLYQNNSLFLAGENGQDSNQELRSSTVQFTAPGWGGALGLPVAITNNGGYGGAAHGFEDLRAAGGLGFYVPSGATSPARTPDAVFNGMTGTLGAGGGGGGGTLVYPEVPYSGGNGGPGGNGFVILHY